MALTAEAGDLATVRIDLLIKREVASLREENNILFLLYLL